MMQRRKVALTERMASTPPTSDWAAIAPFGMPALQVQMIQQEQIHQHVLSFIQRRPGPEDDCLLDGFRDLRGDRESGRALATRPDLDVRPWPTQQDQDALLSRRSHPQHGT